MKAFFKTSMIVMAAAGILALSAGTALAGPGGIYLPDQNTQINPEVVAAIHSLVQNGQLQPIDPDPAVDGGGEDDVVSPDSPGEDSLIPPEGGDIECLPGTPGCDDGNDQPGEPGNPGELDNPETPPATTGQPPVTTETPRVPSSKLPNTGTQLVILAGLGLTVAMAALMVRRFAMRRTR
ncbi:MAG: LPXTG cell wall anchor domain-containing protein [Thermoleophilia bacterium]